MSCSDSPAFDEPPVPPVVVQVKNPDQDKFPDLGTLKETVLRNTLRVRKVARYAVIRSRHSGDKHHDALTLRTWKKTNAVCSIDPDHSISLTSEGEDEIEKLYIFLKSIRGGSTASDTDSHVVISTKQIANSVELQRTLNAISADGNAETLAFVLEKATTDEAVFKAILDRAAKDPLLFAESAAALNLAAYKSAVAELRQLIEKDGVLEGEFQTLLGKFPWMFGSEYSELLKRRTFTRDDRKDFVMRRTTDGYIEVIEIKTPLGGANLFGHDESHDSYYAKADLSKVIGQVQRYLVELDADRLRIIAVDSEDTNKIRAKVVIGRDGDENQKKALRTFNGHLHRIEVLTFDQLLRIAERVISYLESSLQRRKW